MIGVTLHQYQITARIGAGGMGEVFRARDTRLNRDVALKMLPKEFVADADRLRRFEQEAKTLAALNHPNVMTIHDAGVHEGAPYLVTELLEGTTLREEMNSGAFPVHKTTDYVLQIVHGLAAAHGKGVIHRDLKPENIFVTKDGRLKILDFGLAKLQDPSRAVRPLSPLGGERDGVRGEATTLRVEAEAILNPTEPGMVMGTPAYMSPEQVCGDPADHRTDIFAFGCVLYEMLSGTRAFRRNTSVESMNAVLHDTPPELRTTHPNIPLGLTRIVERCLEKQPDNRFQSAKDLAFALRESSSAQNTPPGASAAAKPAARRMLAAGVVLLAVVLGVWGLFQFRSRSRPSSGRPQGASALSARLDKSVAVLPFVNLSPDKADEYLSDGITEELLQALAKVKGLRVPGRSSSFAFKGRSEQGLHRTVGEQLHVGAVLEGSVRKAGERLRVAAQLTSVAEGFTLWSDTYERDMTNIFAIQSEIASRVAKSLRVELLGETVLAKPPTENLEAFKLYLQGRKLWNERTGETLTEAIGYFNRAIALDPTYALAHAGLADTYVLLDNYASLPARETAPNARAAANRALELDDTLAEPRAALARVKGFFDWDWAGAEAEFRRAIELNPNYATSFHWLGNVFWAQRRNPEALAQYQRAVEIDPLSPIIQGLLAQGLFDTGKEKLAIETLQKQIALNPGFQRHRTRLGDFRLRQGASAAAILEFETAHQLAPDDMVSEGLRGFACARVGRIDDAQQVLRRLLERHGQGRDPSLFIALVYHGLGNDDQALDWLERAAESRVSILDMLNRSPHWNDLRPHPRFQAILRKMNLIP